MNYRDEVKRGMSLLARQPNVIFCGQGVSIKANAMFEQLEGVPKHQRLEVPVFENTQLGMCLGMSLAGLLPVCLFPRTNFLLLAIDQLVNHLDKWQQMTGKPAKVIVKTMSGCTRPLDPGPQHSGERLVRGLDLLCGNVLVEDMALASMVYPAYQNAVKRDSPTLLVERGNLYG